MTLTINSQHTIISLFKAKTDDLLKFTNVYKNNLITKRSCTQLSLQCWCFKKGTENIKVRVQCAQSIRRQSVCSLRNSHQVLGWIGLTLLSTQSNLREPPLSFLPF